jgi:sigma-B regulation protein RsbU (phosphoserine phosphatase)
VTTDRPRSALPPRGSRLSLRWRILALILGLNVLLTTGFTWWGYRTERRLTMDDVDEDLLMGALVLRQYLSDRKLSGEFHDAVFDGLRMSDEELFRTMRPLYDLARERDYAYLYTLVEKDGAYRFVVDSPGGAEVEAGAAGDSFLHPWEGPVDMVRQAAAAGRPTFAEYVDAYGEFRTVFVPFQTPRGRTYLLGVDVRLTDLHRRMRRNLLVPIVGGLVMLAVSLVLGALSIRRVVQPLRRLAAAAGRIATGDLDTEVPRVAARDEVGDLSRAFEDMRRALKEYIADLAETTSAKERIESELKIAHAIQMSFLPKRLLPSRQPSAFELEALLEPAKEVGGDLYDYFFVDDDHLFFAVGDVSDKGVPAALFMAVTKTLIKGIASRDTPPSEVLERVNRELCTENTEAMFVTVFCGILDLRSGELRYSNAGHNPPLALRTGGAAEWLDVPPGLVLGVEADSPYETRTGRLAPGDMLLAYSDGVTEAMNPQRQLFSDARLKGVAAECSGKAAAETVQAVLRSTRAFASGATQSDDITILAVRYKGPATG